MFQPIPPITPAPPAALAPQNATAVGGLDIATGPLPQTSAADALRFSEAIRAGNVENVARQRVQPGSRVWADAGRSLSGALKGISTQDVAVRKMLHDRASTPGVGEGHRGDASGPGGEVDLMGGLPQDPQALLRLEMEENGKVMREGMAMTEFSVTAEFVGHAGQETTGAVKQLANGGNG